MSDFLAYRASRDKLVNVSSHPRPKESVCNASIGSFESGVRSPCEGSMNFFHKVLSHGRGYAEAIPSRSITEENEAVLVPIVILESERRLGWE